MAAIVSEADAKDARQRLEEAGETVFQIGRIESGPRGCTISGSAGTWSARSPWTASHGA